MRIIRIRLGTDPRALSLLGRIVKNWITRCLKGFQALIIKVNVVTSSDSWYLKYKINVVRGFQLF
jgi:hypothetical protein